MTHLTLFILATFIIATSFTASTEAAVAPIWLAPKNLNYPATVNSTFDPDVFENFTANLGEWATIEVATGARGNRALSVMDSKGIIWILGGTLARFGDAHFLTAVWNFNPKTDQYRYVWKTSDSSPFVARNAGDLRVPALSNHPGGIRYGTAAIDKDDNIWMYSYEYWGELWMFNTSSWMFVRQFGSVSETSQPSVGANPGQPGEDVWPGYIEGHCMVIDSKNDLWILSGSNPRSTTNTVWHFNMTSFLWTLVTGSVVPDGDASNTTFYGGAWLNGCDIDDNDRVWIYGGQVSIGSVSGDYGDLCTFDTRTTREWEFEYGQRPLNSDAQVVSQDYHIDNHPPAAEGAALIDRRDGTLMLVPGASSAYGYSNTVWQYSKSLKQWRLVYGNISAEGLDTQGDYTNFRAPGSIMPGYIYLSYAAGKHNGDLYLIGGTVNLFIDGLPNRKDIWLIPNYCKLNNCSNNAECVDEIIGYSCKCKDGFTGDGFTCTVISPTPPIANVPSTAPVANSNTPSAKVSGASIVSYSVVSALIIAVAVING